MKDITKHEWFSEDIEEVTICNDKVVVRFCDEEFIGEIELSEQDSIALAKHYGHYQKPDPGVCVHKIPNTKFCVECSIDVFIPANKGK